MAKNLKINIKNTQIAQAISLGQAKKESQAKKEGTWKEGPRQEGPRQEGPRQEGPRKEGPKMVPAIGPRKESEIKETLKKGAEKKEPSLPAPAEEDVANGASPVRKKARSKSHFGDASHPHPDSHSDSHAEGTHIEEAGEVIAAPLESSMEVEEETVLQEVSEVAVPPSEDEPAPIRIKAHDRPSSERAETPIAATLRKTESKAVPPKPLNRPMVSSSILSKRDTSFLKALPIREKFGPTGKHVKDLLPPPKPERPLPARGAPGAREFGARPGPRTGPGHAGSRDGSATTGAPVRGKSDTPGTSTTESTDAPAAKKPTRFKEFKDLKPTKKQDSGKFDSRDRQGLRAEEDQRWRKRKSSKADLREEDTTIRPASLKIRLPIVIKDLAQVMKLKASQLVQKLFLRGIVVTLNDLLEDPTTIQLLGHEFGCEIAIDTSQEERIRVTDKTAQQEIHESDTSKLVKRPPVVAFMGHVDHGKTSLIDAIRKTNRVQGEAGAITQHIGAFMCTTQVGNIAILDTPGHEAFSEMRKRGANITDIVVLVIAGDEGIRQQTIEAIQHAKEAKVTIVVALNKCDKPNFNAENVYRQLADQDLLPEQWGGQTICIHCSAVTAEGIPTLLEMLALQADVLELRANPNTRARGRVIESEMHKGMGPRATVLVINGSLRKGDALVFEQHYGRIKTMHDDLGNDLDVAGPAQPVEITGLSGLPEAGQEFIVVASEKEAKQIIEIRFEELKAKQAKKKIASFENLLQEGQKGGKKTLNLVLRADVQGSLEAIKTALQKIESAKCDLNIVYAGVGEISESDVQLASASKAMILGFHTQVESHAEELIKILGIQVKLHDIIYHAIDEIKAAMKALLDKIAIENEVGKAEVRATFKSSQLGIIAGCQVIEGVIQRSNLIRIKRNSETIFKGQIASLKKIKEDVREVGKGQECGILISNFSTCEVGDIIEAYEMQYLIQEL